MKMSDTFALPVTGAAVHVNVFQLKGHYNDGKTPFDAIDIAVNNHDKLTNFLKQCASFADSQDAFDSCALNGIAINAKTLLDELNA